LESLLQSGGGDHRKVDMLVGDIYGQQGTAELGLPADLLASSLAQADKGANKAELTLMNADSNAD
jgi:pantothenate kinase